MGKGIILLADNLEDFTRTRAEFLRRKGYEVYCAHSPEQARETLRRQWIHLAILDIRLSNDDDEEDESGLQLAKDPEFSHVAKMLLTGFPSVDNVREALTPDRRQNSNILRFVSKKEGVDEMIRNVDEIFEAHVHVNSQLKIHWKNPTAISLSGLLNSLNPALAPDEIAGRIRELDDLLRMTFGAYDQITLQRYLWERDGRTALDVSAFSDNSIVPIVLQIHPIDAAGTRPAAALPSVDPQAARLLHEGRTNHYRALAWKVDVPLSDFQPMTDFVHENTDKRIANALENLFVQALAPWYQMDLHVVEGDPAQVYGELLRRSVAHADAHGLQQKIQKLLKTCVAAKSIVSFSLEQDSLSIQFTQDRRLVFSDPIAPLHSPRSEDRILRQVRSPGLIVMDAILVDRQANVAVTDFFRSEVVPCELDFITMELDARVRESGTDNLLNILEMEQELAGLDELTATLSAASVDPDCRKSLAMIFAIRHLAQQVFQSNVEDYRIGLYHLSLMRLGQWDGDLKYTPQELVQSLHYLLICAFIANRGERGPADPRASTRQAGIFIDEDNHEVRLNGRVISLTPTEYELLTYLHQRHGNLCRREEIMRDVFKIDANDPISEKSLLNTHMGRLRMKIEADLDNPQYLQTVRGQGYKLVMPPQ